MKKIVFTFSIILLASFGIIQAQTKRDTLKNVIRLKGIEVNESKIGSDLQELPNSATPLSDNDILDFQINNFNNLSGVVSNLYIPNYGTKFTSPIFIRGIGSRLYTPPIGIYVDNVPYFDKSSFNFDYFDIERVEILRGPQGSLFGRNTMGGIINIYTQQPCDEMRAKINLNYGNYNSYNANIAYNQPITDNLFVLANISTAHTDGFLKNTFNDSKADDMTDYAGRIKILYKPTTRLSIELSSYYDMSDENGNAFSQLDRMTKEPKDIAMNDTASYKRSMISNGLHINYLADNYSIHSATTYQYIDGLQKIDQDYTADSIFYRTHQQYTNIISEEITVSSNEQKAYNWLFGLMGFTQFGKSEIDLLFEPGAAKMGMPQMTDFNYYDDNIYGAAIFHQSIFKIDDFTFTGGIRFDYESQTQDYKNEVFMRGKLAPAQYDSSDLDFFEFLPKISIQYNITNNSVPYITVAKGYKTGGINSLYDTTKPEQKIYDPEYSWNYEIGIKNYLLDNTLNVNFSAFYIDLLDQQIAQQLSSGLGMFLINAGKSHSCGFELEANYKITNNFTAWLNFGYTNSKFDEYTSNGIDYAENYVPYVPQYTCNLGGSYNFDIGAKFLSNILLHVDLAGIGKHYWTDANKAQQDAYFLLNAKVNFQITNEWQLSIWGRNLTNTKYDAFYFESMGSGFIQDSEPLKAGVGLTFAL